MVFRNRNYSLLLVTIVIFLFFSFGCFDDSGGGDGSNDGGNTITMRVNFDGTNPTAGQNLKIGIWYSQAAIGDTLGNGNPPQETDYHILTATDISNDYVNKTITVTPSTVYIGIYIDAGGGEGPENGDLGMIYHIYDMTIMNANNAMPVSAGDNITLNLGTHTVSGL